MFSFDKTTQMIKITRGDSGAEKLTLKFDGKPYQMQEGDVIQFGLKTDYDDPECILQKDYTENPFILSFVPADTKDLEYGSYVWDMQIVIAETGFTRTFLDKKKFRVTEEVV